ncbi:MAG: NAD(P)/FAD-dependent oxidoreductase [Candidatus Aminicenantia bacterium]
MPSEDFGPLKDGSTVVIIGGGPAGCGCALRLHNLSTKKGIVLNIIIYEGKTFEGERQFNQCAGVLSPPIKDILEKELNIEFPFHLVQRIINGYVLHSDSNSIILDGEGELSYAIRRIKFDEYLLNQAIKKGIKVVNARMVDLEFQRDGVIVYSENRNTKADVVVGAFGLDDGSIRIFERCTPYREPEYLDSIVTKIHPEKGIMERFGNRIHAFLPSIKEIEFGAVTPKGNHLTINIAGEKIKSSSMDKFLCHTAVKNIVPSQEKRIEKKLTYFKGKFPISPARGIYGDRYVIIGDSAGLVRPFKGKGVNSGLLTGINSARVMMEEGISKKAFEKFYKECREILEDLPYAKLVRRLAILFSNIKFMPHVVDLAKSEGVLQQALFDCVSANRNYREIVRDNLNLKIILKFLGRFIEFVI